MQKVKFKLFVVISFKILATFIFTRRRFLNRAFRFFCYIILGFYILCTVNSGISFTKVVAAIPPLDAKTSTKVFGDFSQSPSTGINKQANSIVAFKADEEGVGHREITKETIDGDMYISIDPITQKKSPRGTWKPIEVKDRDGKTLRFTSEAREEVYQGNRSVDLKPGSDIIFSEDFDKAENHFDNEKLVEGSQRLKKLKEEIFEILKPIKNANDKDAKDRGKKARELLGKALHTLQDFYAHTNWVELGFTVIDKRLGREVIPKNPAKDLYTSEPVSNTEIASVASVQASVAAGSIKLPGIYKILGIVVAKKVLNYKPEELAAAISTKPGILSNKFKNIQNKNLLTSGYFIGVGPIASCTVPRGKTRHGAGLLGCPNGFFLSLSGGGKIAKNGNSYVVDFPSGEKLVATLAQVGGNYYFNVSPFVYNQPQRISGLLGDFNGKPDNDQKIRGGSALASKSTYGDLKKVLDLVGIGQPPSSLKGAEELYFEQLYKDFSNSWRVKQQESLFDYPTGKTTANYTDASFPDKYLKLEMLSSDQIRKARNACMEAKVSQDLMEGCIFDVGFSGFSEFARTTGEINGYINTVKKLFPDVNIPTVTNMVDQVVPKKICTFGICIDRPF